MQNKQIQTQKEEQTLQTNAIQVAFARLVELPLMDMEARVRNELAGNEALEEGASEDPEGFSEMENSSTTESLDNAESTVSELEDRTADYANSDDIPEYLLRQQYDREEREIQIGQQNNIYDEINRQIGEYDLDEHKKDILEYLIGSLDDNGYLTKDDDLLADEMEIYHNILTTPEEVKEMRGLLQTFDPKGLGAKDLQECLCIQLCDPDFNSPAKDIALSIVKDCFHDFSLKHWKEICRKLGIGKDELNEAKHTLMRLNPRPGSNLNDCTQQSAPTVIPDFFLEVDDNGVMVISLNRGDIPELRVSQSFRETIQRYANKSKQLSRVQNEELIYARKKVNSAQLFIDLIKRRRETLLSVMRTIAHLQSDFFLNEDDETKLLPMTLKDVAQNTEIDISTISRVTSSKYVQTRFGQYGLKYFFSSSFKSEEGEELSSRQAKVLLQELIDNEDKSKPFSDEKLSLMMKEKGQPISRRTVVKYREQMGIPKSIHRKN